MSFMLKTGKTFTYIRNAVYINDKIPVYEPIQKFIKFNENN